MEVCVCVCVRRSVDYPWLLVSQQWSYGAILTWQLKREHRTNSLRMNCYSFAHAVCVVLAPDSLKELCKPCRKHRQNLADGFWRRTFCDLCNNEISIWVEKQLFFRNIKFWPLIATIDHSESSIQKNHFISPIILLFFNI